MCDENSPVHMLMIFDLQGVLAPRTGGDPSEERKEIIRGDLGEISWFLFDFHGFIGIHWVYLVSN